MRYGSLVNTLVGNSNGSSRMKPTSEITVGMGATQILWSDRNPYTVVKIKSKNRIIVKRDDPYRIDNNGHGSESQEWYYREVTEDDFNTREDYEAIFEELILTKKGWKELGGSTVFTIGAREKYYDFTF